MPEFPEWWVPSELPRFRERNRWFAAVTYWMEPAIPPRHNMDAVFDSHDARRAFEYFAWLYELDGRLRGQFLFRAPVCGLWCHGLNAILGAAHPNGGTSRRWSELTAHDPGPAVVVRGGGRGGGPILSEWNGFTPWRYFHDRLTGARAAVPVSMNLRCSNSKIEAELTRCLAALGLASSRARIRKAIRSMRMEFAETAPPPTAGKGSRRAAVPWNWLGPVEDAVRSGKVVHLALASRISEAKRYHRADKAVIDSWQASAAAVVELDRRAKT